MENIKENLDLIYKKCFNYFINKLDDEDAKSTDVKAAHDFLIAHGYEFKLDDADVQAESERKAEEACRAISDEEILEFGT